MQAEGSALDPQAVDHYGRVGVGEGKGASSSRHSEGAHQLGTEAEGGGVSLGQGVRAPAFGTSSVCERVSVRV